MINEKLKNLGRIIGAKTDDDSLKKVKDLFSLANCKDFLLIQKPGDVFKTSLIDLTDCNPDAKHLIMRIEIELTDWEVGHFSSYDSQQRTDWKIGDVTTYDWQSTTICSANASTNNRIVYQLSGVATEKTTEFINRLKRFGNHQLELSDNSWFS